jgi:hypothetical protein
MAEIERLEGNVGASGAAAAIVFWQFMVHLHRKESIMGKVAGRPVMVVTF